MICNDLISQMAALSSEILSVALRRLMSPQQE
jgi:hypothetical protein